MGKWELVEHRVTADFDALTREDFRVQRYGGVSPSEPYGFQRVGRPVG